jgi:hypothetical protein
MKFEYSDNKGERVWGASSHAIDRFMEKNKFIQPGDYRNAIVTMLKMMNKASLLTYDTDKNSDVYYYGSWIFICKDSTIVTVYPKKGSRWERYIND